MRKNRVLNAQFSQAVAETRHGNTIIIPDAGMAVLFDCNCTDLDLIRSMPSFPEVLHAILNNLVAGQYEASDLTPQYNSDIYKATQEMLPNIPGGTASEQKIKELMSTVEVVTRTGEFGNYCNLVLCSASGISRHVGKFHVELPGAMD